jgi:hypothetical protein
LPDLSEEQFAKGALSIRETLQAIEDALIDQGFDEYLVATEHGSFTWRTTEWARSKGSE